MASFFKSFFTNDRCVAVAILLNVTTIVLEEYGVNFPIIYAIDYATIVYFIVEMVLKQVQSGVRNYWKNAWNRLDGSLVILSLPSLVELFVPHLFEGNPSVVLTLRILRLLRFIRLTYFFPNATVILANFKKALKDSSAVLIAALIIMFGFSLISCSLFKEAAPQYFANPGISLYTMFRLFTIEGWYEIPDTVAACYSPFAAAVIRIFFSFVLLLGGIICMSLLNSIFVDAMVSDNNDDIIKDINRLERKMDTILRNQNIDPDSLADDSTKKDEA